MSYIRGESREQVYLLPEAIDDYVGADNPVRFLDAFVEQLDLGALGFMHAPRRTRGARRTIRGMCCGCTSMDI